MRASVIVETKAAVLAAPAAGVVLAGAAALSEQVVAGADIIHDKSVVWLLSSAILASCGLIGWLVKKLFEVMAAFLADRIEDRKTQAAMKDAVDSLVEQLDKRPCALVESRAAKVVMRTHDGHTESMMRAEPEDTPVQSHSIRKKES